MIGPVAQTWLAIGTNIVVIGINVGTNAIGLFVQMQFAIRTNCSTNWNKCLIGLMMG